jgi:ATP-dependent Clp protease ATP-binding subunit ClpX
MSTPDAPKSMSDAHKVYCSFCGKAAAEVKVLVAGPAVFICNECILLCVDILVDNSLPSNVRPLTPVPTEDSK